jgi:phage shock protein A
MSIRDISPTLKEKESKRQRHKDQQQQEEISSKAYKLFSDGKRPVEVAIALSLREPEATKLFIEYCKLKRLHILISIYKATNGELGLFLKLYRLMKEKDMSVEKVVNAVAIAGDKLPYMESLYEQVKEQVDNMQRTRQYLSNDIQALKNKISILDATVFSCEQDCKRKEQQLQELIAQKDRIEKLIANILNGEGYSKIRQMVEENVKAALSENKKLISILFVALIQTLKADPQMIKLIQNIPSANDGEQYKDDNNYIANHLESNKDRILDLAKKHYENLVEALTNNAIATASSNPTLSLPQSSSTLPNPFNQNDIYTE